MKIYKQNYKYDSGPGCYIIALELDAINQKREEMNANEHYTLLGEIEVTENNSLLYCNESSPYKTFLADNLVYVGERHLDARCTGTKPFYTRKDLVEEATAQFEQECKKQLEDSDSYYNQPWV